MFNFFKRKKRGPSPYVVVERKVKTSSKSYTYNLVYKSSNLNCGCSVGSKCDCATNFIKTTKVSFSDVVKPPDTKSYRVNLNTGNGISDDYNGTPLHTFGHLFVTTPKLTDSIKEGMFLFFDTKAGGSQIIPVHNILSFDLLGVEQNEDISMGLNFVIKREDFNPLTDTIILEEK